MLCDVITTRKRSLRRLCFHRCLSVHGGDVWQEACVVGGGRAWQGVSVVVGERMVEEDFELYVLGGSGDAKTFQFSLAAKHQC